MWKMLIKNTKTDVSANEPQAIKNLAIRKGELRYSGMRLILSKSFLLNAGNFSSLSLSFLFFGLRGLSFANAHSIIRIPRTQFAIRYFRTFFPKICALIT